MNDLFLEAQYNDLAKLCYEMGLTKTQTDQIKETSSQVLADGLIARGLSIVITDPYKASRFEECRWLNHV